MTRSRRTGQNGPFGTEELHDSYLFENVYGRCNKRIRFNLLLTSPVKKLSDVHRKPLIVLLNGFQCRAGWYSSYARYLASWGFHILQYNPPALQIIADTVEIACVLVLLEDWLKRQDADESLSVYKAIDWDRLLIAGHSRGAKLATLLYVETDRFQAAFLIDPVDNTKDSPESETSPSACKALQASGKKVAIMGAGLIGSCNPEGSNYKEFWRAAGKGSWLGLVPDAGHQQFLDAGWALNKGFDWLCKCGPSTRQDVAAATQHAMLAWFEDCLQGTASLSAVLRSNGHTASKATCCS